MLLTTLRQGNLFCVAIPDTMTVTIKGRWLHRNKFMGINPSTQIRYKNCLFMSIYVKNTQSFVRFTCSTTRREVIGSSRALINLCLGTWILLWCYFWFSQEETCYIVFILYILYNLVIPVFAIWLFVIIVTGIEINQNH